MTNHIEGDSVEEASPWQGWDQHHKPSHRALHLKFDRAFTASCIHFPDWICECLSENENRKNVVIKSNSKAPTAKHQSRRICINCELNKSFTDKIKS